MNGGRRPPRPVSLISGVTRFAPNRVFVALLLGALSGGLYALAIPLILSAVSKRDDELAYSSEVIVRIFGVYVIHIRLAGFFLLTCLLILVVRALAATIMMRVGLDFAAELRQRLCHRIVRSAYPRLEALGQSKLMVAVTTDVRVIVTGAEVVPQLLTNGVMIAGLLGFLSFIDAHVFIFVLEATAFGVVTFQLPVMLANRHFRVVRKLYDDVEKGLRGLILGIKELQEDRQKRDSYFSTILRPSDQDLLAAEKRARTILFAANSYGDLLFFFAIGTIAFVFVNYHGIAADDLIAVVMALLYMTTPVSIILNTIPRLSMATVSLRKIEEILGELPDKTESEQPLEERPWSSISFDQVTYRHGKAGVQESFVVGPLNLSVRKGEITFIVGGNGSGKSTLCKMLSLHYPPESGHISFGDHHVDPSSRGDLRQGIAMIFSDFYLFDRLLCTVDDERLELINHYLEKFGIADKVQVRDSIFSTTELSDGQRKRLALAISFVDDKDLYLLDEWAADQEPVFKRVFYTEILQELKALGKAVVVVSHDDRYFHVADQLIIMEEGSIVETRRMTTVSEGPARV